MLATIRSAIVQGVSGNPITVEVHVGPGLPGYTVVGLPDASCRESRDRVRAALLSSGYKFPSSRVTINLAPSSLKKHGSSLDLPIALALLAASNQVPVESLNQLGATGELGLDGSVRPVEGLVCVAASVTAEQILVPERGKEEAAAVRPGRVRAVGHLRDIVPALKGENILPSLVEPPTPETAPCDGPDLADVRGQPLARFALEVAAAGAHHLLLIGSPGSGKTMLAARLAGLLPDLKPEQARLATGIHSAAGLVIPPGGLVRRPPYRAPHHGSSSVALVGGGTAALRPGEITCAHDGVLFLDELGEFPVSVLDALRQPLEEGVIRVSRVARSATLPARFLFVAAMNPCPCGGGDLGGYCRCSSSARMRYARRLSGPLLDRFDLRIEVARPDPSLLMSDIPEEGTETVAARVTKVRQMAAARGVDSNSQLSLTQLKQLNQLSSAGARLLETSLSSGLLTGRGLKRVQSVARTIADLQGSDEVDADHIAVALSLRASPRTVVGRAE